MSQITTSLSLTDGDGQAVLDAINEQFGAFQSTHAGATAPTLTAAGMLWYDTTNQRLRLRNIANSDWVTLPIDLTDGSIVGIEPTAPVAADGCYFILTSSISGTLNISIGGDQTSTFTDGLEVLFKTDNGTLLDTGTLSQAATYDGVNDETDIVTTNTALPSGAAQICISTAAATTSSTSAVNTGDIITLLGDMIGDGVFDSTGNMSIDTSINLPNVVLIDGGDSASTYPGELTGPYGVLGGGGGSSIEVQDDGTSLTAGVLKVNFVGAGVSVQEPVADEVNVVIPGSLILANDSEYCPGYTYTNVDTDTWRVEGLNVANLFNIGRRLKFIDGANTYYGTITSRDYNTTAVGHTTINMSMENADTLNGTITEVCFVTGVAGWSPVADSTFGTTAINAIAAGNVGGTNYYVAVGNNGKLAISSDNGDTWSAATLTTTEHLNDICFNTTVEKFFIGGNNGVLIESNSISANTWIEDTTTIPGFVSGGTGHILNIGFQGISGDLLLLFNDVSNGYRVAYSQNNGASWTESISGTLDSIVPNTLTPRVTIDSWAVTRTNIANSYVLSTPSGSWSNLDTWTGKSFTAAKMFFVSGNEYRMYGADDGSIRSFGNGALDDVNLSAFPVRAFAYSDLHSRWVAVGDNAQIATLELSAASTADSWVVRENGFSPTANIKDVCEFNNVFIAVADNGQICRSTSGVN